MVSVGGCWGALVRKARCLGIVAVAAKKEHEGLGWLCFSVHCFLRRLQQHSSRMHMSVGFEDELGVLRGSGS